MKLSMMTPIAKLKARPCAVRPCREPRPGRIPLRLPVVRAGNLDLSKSKLI